MRMPRLRFRADDGSEFPDWEERTSVELCSRMIGGGTPSTSNTDNYNGDISWISSSDLDVDNITTVRRTRFITEGAIANSATKKVKPGSIAVVLRVGVGKVALLDRETCTSQDFISLEGVTGDTKFIAYMLSARMQREAVRTQGTSIKGIPATRFKELTYRMPSSIIEQRKIADLLSTVDDVIVVQQAEVDAWEQRKKGVMQKLLSQEVRFKADDGSEFPDWEERTSVELCSRMIGGGTPSTSNTDNYNGDISWISSSDLDVDNITTVRRTRFITEGAIANSATKKVKPGSIAVVLRVGVGKVALLDRETCTSQDFISLEGVTGDTKFIAYMLSARMQREAVRTQGTSIKGIPATRFKELTYRMPSSIIEQRKIADLLSTVDDVIVKAKAELAKWQELKKGLLQQMFV